MPRELSSRDIELLKIMAPEFSGEQCSGSGMPYRSLLPPVANHYATSNEDFKARLERLPITDLRYLVDLIMSGEESLHCIPPEYYAILESRISETLGEDIARHLGSFYAMSCE
jgi:hypothetical protein